MRPMAQKGLMMTEVDTIKKKTVPLTDCIQNLPEKVKPFSGPLVKIIILLSACKANSLTY